MNALVLAGGKASRMGKGKFFLRIEEEILIERYLRILCPLFVKVIIVTNLPILYKDYSVLTVEDLIPGLGPLGGIYSGLLASDQEANFVFSCDMPFLDSSFISYMQSLVSYGQVIIPSIGEGLYEPLHAIYHTQCLPWIRGMIENRNYKVQNLLQYVHSFTVTPEVIGRFKNGEKMFANINRPEDLQKLNASTTS